MNKTTLYKLDSMGRKRQWSIWLEQEADHTDIVLETGLVDGGKVEQRIPIFEGKNVGKQNSTTHFTQAQSEMQSKIDKQLRAGYVRNLEDVKESGTLGSGLMSPMSAQKHDPTGVQKGSKTLEKLKILGKKIHVQPKLDGNRCIVKVESTPSGIKAGMYTRKGDFMPVQLQHVLMDVLFCYEKMGLQKEIFLDGELFSTELSFNELNGHLKRKDSQDPIALAKIKYHVYDCMENMPYDARLQNIQNFFGKAGEFGKEITSVKIIDSFPITATDENIKEKLEEFLAEGHEGLMIRTLDTPYENKRSWSLLKVKLFEDFETEILDLEEDSMGRLGYAVMKMPEPVIDRNGKLVTDFKAGFSGVDHEEGKKMLVNKHDYIGKQATIEHFGWDIRPRFPKFKAVREN